MTMTMLRLSVFLHVVAAAFWLGATLFIAAVLVPALRGGVDPRLRADLLDATGRRLRALTWPAFGLLTATGVYQLHARGFGWADLGGPLWRGAFGRALAIKLILVAIVWVLSAIHDFHWGPQAGRGAGTGAAERHRRRAAWAGRITLLIGLGVFFWATRLARGGL